MAEKQNLSSMIESVAKSTKRMCSMIKSFIPSFGASSSNSAYNPEKEIEVLRRQVSRIQAVLDDAEERDVRDATVKLWLEELKGVAYDAEDIVDEYDYEMLRSKVEAQNRSSETTRKRKREDPKEVCSLITPPAVSIPDDFEARIKNIKELSNEINRDREVLRLTDEHGKRIFRNTAELSRETTSFVHESDVYGREQDKEKLIELLLAEGESSQSSLSVIPVIGMGGIGKTTLAQLVYNDPRVRQYFSRRAWVCVSENFDASRLLREILQSLTGEACPELSTDIICQKLREQFHSRSFLLILDDVWNEKASLWESVKAPLTGVGMGKIIVTTRHVSVARIMQTGSPYCLGCLPEDICWSLFLHRAFGSDEDPKKCVSLKEIGKKIVNKCKGLPLAVTALGGLLRFETSEERWTEVLESDMWELDEEKDDILPVLKLSYIHMPAYLRRCFVYCSMFPKDHEFKKDHIVQLWMSQGLIRRSTTRRQQLEDTGNAYFEELTCRSFFQKGGKDYNGVVFYVMHDLHHDLAQSMAKEECHSIEASHSYNLPKKVRHLSLLPDCWKRFTKKSIQPLIDYRDLRTVVCVITKETYTHSEIVIENRVFQNLTCLRVLELCYVNELPDSVGHLKHLRYLCLRGSKISRLPNSIWHLHNLLVLTVESQHLKELPEDIKNLIHLRHLKIRLSKIYLPPGVTCVVGQLTSLRSLEGVVFNVARDGAHRGIGGLKNLVHLKGHLRIHRLENVTSLEDAKEAKMDNKQHLESLTLEWSTGDPSSSPEQGSDQYAYQMLEELIPHTTNCHLKELTIGGYRGNKLPSCLYDPSFSKLVMLVLKDFDKGFAFLPPLGQLPSLRLLEIRQMFGIRCVGREFYGGDLNAANRFPSLEELQFLDMPEWVEWDGAKDGDFSRLRGLTLENCPKLTSLPPLGQLPFLEHLNIQDMPEWVEWDGVKDGDFPCLQKLFLQNCPKLTSLPACVPSDIDLVIKGCPLVENWCKEKGIRYKEDVFRRRFRRWWITQ